MRDAQTFFEQALAEHGVNYTEVSVNESPDGLVLSFAIYTTIGGEKRKFATQVTRETLEREGKQKAIALEAQKIARETRNLTEEQYSWADRHIKVHPYDGTAYCFRCSTEVKVPRGRPQFVAEAELSYPRPMPLNREKALEEMSGASQAILKAYLVGRLRERCEDGCPNNKFTRGKLAGAAD